MEQTQENKSIFLQELVDKGCMFINAKIFQYGLCVEPAKDNAQGALAVDVKFLSKEGIGPKDVVTVRINNVNTPMDVLHKFGHAYKDMEVDVGERKFSYTKLHDAIKSAYKSLTSDKSLREKFIDLENQWKSFNRDSKQSTKTSKKTVDKSDVITLKPKKNKDGREVYEAEM